MFLYARLTRNFAEYHYYDDDDQRHSLLLTNRQRNTTTTTTILWRWWQRRRDLWQLLQLTICWQCRPSTNARWWCSCWGRYCCWCWMWLWLWISFNSVQLNCVCLPWFLPLLFRLFCIIIVWAIFNFRGNPKIPTNHQ